MSLKLLVAAALAAVDVADDMVFDAEMKTTQALDKLRELRDYLEAAPKTAVELVDGCEHLVRMQAYVDRGHYIFTRRQLEDFAQTAFAAGCAHGYASLYDTAVQAGKPVHDDKKCSGTQCAAQEATSLNNKYESIPPAQADLVDIRRTKESAVDLQFSDGTNVHVSVRAK